MGTKIPANKYLIENFNQIIELEIYAISSQLYFLTRFELLVEFFFKKKNLKLNGKSEEISQIQQ